MELYPTPGPDRDLDGCPTHTATSAPSPEHRFDTGSIPRARRKVHQTSAAVDTARLVIIDPSYLGPEGERIALDFVARGLAVLVGTPADGWYPVEVADEGLLIRPSRWIPNPEEAFYPMSGDEYLASGLAEWQVDQ